MSARTDHLEDPMTATATRLYALIAALLIAVLAALTAPAMISHLAPASHQNSSFTTANPDNGGKRCC
jgi:hypothetical protein